jgi:hypothetical protein
LNTKIFVLFAIIAIAIASDSEIKIKAGLLSRTLEDIQRIDPSKLTCATPQKQFLQINHDLEQWADILDHKNDIG